MRTRRVAQPGQSGGVIGEHRKDVAPHWVKTKARQDDNHPNVHNNGNEFEDIDMMPFGVNVRLADACLQGLHGEAHVR
jgi:hypothetical protein